MYEVACWLCEFYFKSLCQELATELNIGNVITFRQRREAIAGAMTDV